MITSSVARSATFGLLVLAGCGQEGMNPSTTVRAGESGLRTPTTAGEDAQVGDPVSSDAVLFVQHQHLAPNDVATTDSCGASVALEGDTMVVGCPGDDASADGKGGAAYVFTRDLNGAWAQSAKLQSSDWSQDDRFGASVALEGSTIVVGAPGAGGSGAAYVFGKSGAVWTQAAKVTSAAPAAGDNFGAAVSLSGATLAVGAPERATDGVLCVFTESGQAWQLQTEIVIPNTGAIPIPLQTGRWFALEGDRLALSTTTFPLGRAFVYERVGSVWQQTADLADAAGPVALGGDRLATAMMSSTVRVYELSGSSWVETDFLGLAQFTTASSLSLLGDTIAVGVSSENVTNGYLNEGAVRVFRHDGAMWNPEEVVSAQPAVNQGYFGASVGLESTALVVGASGGAGSVYAFALKLATGSACFDATGCEEGFCVDGVCCNVACGGGDSTDCMACSIAMGAATDGICSARPAGTVCRPAATLCDTAEVCDGAFFSCPADSVAPDGAPCDDGDPCSVGDTCHTGLCGAGPDMCGTGGAGGGGGAGGSAGGTGQGGQGGSAGGGASSGGAGGQGGSGGAASSSSGGMGGGGAAGEGGDSTGGGAFGGAASSAGGGGRAEPPDDARLVPVETGCGCRVAARDRTTPAALWLIAALAAAQVARRRPRERAPMKRGTR